MFNLVGSEQSDIVQRASAVCFICSLKCHPKPPPKGFTHSGLITHGAQQHGYHEYLISIYCTWRRRSYSADTKQKRLPYERTNMKLGFTYKKLSSLVCGYLG